jgi:hypothetical protein
MSDISKITASHRERLCLVYVRQSTLAQTRANTESLERQYELAGRAVALVGPGAGPGGGRRPSTAAAIRALTWA